MQKQASPLVYVVDDEELIASTVAAVLRMAGFSALAFANPFDALGAVVVQTPALLISDLIMPQLNGMELAIRIQAIYPECKVLLFSG